MGEIIKNTQISSYTDCSLKPVILCNCDSEVKQKAQSLNVIIARKLNDIPLKSRTRKLEQCVIDSIKTFDDGVIIKDFDVLFNPDYKIDVITILISVCKIKPFSVIWPGKYNDGILIYAEDGFSDYKTYNINNYDITCVI